MKISKDKLKTIIIIVVSFIIGFVLAYLIEKNQPLEIPQLFAKNEIGTCVEFIRGGYTWEKGLFKKQCMIADSIHPKDFEYKQENTMYVRANEKLIISNNSNFENDYDFTISDVNLYSLVEQEKDIQLDIKLNPDLEYSKNEIILPNLEGKYTLTVTIDYAENKVVIYSIKIIFEK